MGSVNGTCTWSCTPAAVVRASAVPDLLAGGVGAMFHERLRKAVQSDIRMEGGIVQTEKQVGCSYWLKGHRLAEARKAALVTRILQCIFLRALLGDGSVIIDDRVQPGDIKIDDSVVGAKTSFAHHCMGPESALRLFTLSLEGSETPVKESMLLMCGDGGRTISRSGFGTAIRGCPPTSKVS